MKKLSFGQRLEVLRKRSGYPTQKAFLAHAKKYEIHFTPRRYASFESGVGRPNIDEISDICRLMEFSADEWIKGLPPRIPLNINALTEEEIEFVNYFIEGLKKLNSGQ